MRAHEFIVEGRPQIHDQDTIDLVKMAWDDGKSAPEISADYNLSKNTVNDILTRYHPTRQRKVLHLAKALTDAERDDIVFKFINNMQVSDIAKIYGISQIGTAKIIKNKIGLEKYNEVIAKYKSLPNIRINRKVTPAILDKIKELYVSGETLLDISNYLDNLIEPGTVRRVMLRQPDYAELRNARDERLRKINTGSVATTKIHRPGTIDNQRSKGPGSKHTHGMFPSSKWGMYKP